MTDERQAGLRPADIDLFDQRIEVNAQRPSLAGYQALVTDLRAALAAQVPAQSFTQADVDAAYIKGVGDHFDHIARLIDAGADPRETIDVVRKLATGSGEAALAAQAPAQEERLNVERLARALDRISGPHHGSYWDRRNPADYVLLTNAGLARQVAAEYRALGVEPKEEGAGS